MQRTQVFPHENAASSPPVAPHGPRLRGPRRLLAPPPMAPALDAPTDPRRASRAQVACAFREAVAWGSRSSVGDRRRACTPSTHRSRGGHRCKSTVPRRMNLGLAASPDNHRRALQEASGRTSTRAAALACRAPSARRLGNEACNGKSFHHTYKGRSRERSRPTAPSTDTCRQGQPRSPSRRCSAMRSCCRAPATERTPS